MLLGVDIGGTHIRIGTIDENNHFIYRKFKFFKDGDINREVINNLPKNIATFFKNNELEQLEGIGISTAAIMDKYKKNVVYWPNNEKWNGYALDKLMKDYYNVPVIFEDDVNAAAYGELMLLRNSGKGYTDFIFISLGTGIGCGIIINRDLYRGSDGHAGELGHVIISDLPKCKCGNNGCLQAVVSADNILADYRLYWGMYCDSFEKLSLEYNDENHAAVRTVKKYSSILATVVCNLSMLFGINTIIFGGGISVLMPMLSENICKIANNLLSVHHKTVQVYNSSLGEWGGVYGALCMIRKHIGG